MDSSCEPGLQLFKLVSYSLLDVLITDYISLASEQALKTEDTSTFYCCECLEERNSSVTNVKLIVTSVRVPSPLLPLFLPTKREVLCIRSLRQE